MTAIKDKSSNALTAAERVKRHNETLMGRLNRLVIGARQTAKNKKLEFNLCRDHLISIWERQNGCCPYTGWAMTTEFNSIKLVSLERKDINRGYVFDNVILVCWCANRARNNMPLQHFKEMCNAISDNKGFNP